MMDKTPFPHHGLPPCPMSADCLLWLDDIDAAQPETFLSTDEQQQLEHVLAHLPTCATCTELIARARHDRTEQRRVLSDFLHQGEKQVPSSVNAILLQVQQEQRQTIAAERSDTLPTIERVPGQTLRPPEPIRAHSRRGPVARTRAAIAFVAVAAVLIVSLALFGQLLPHSIIGGRPTPLPSFSQAQRMPLTPAGSWSSIALSSLSADGKQQQLVNIDPLSGKQTHILTSCCTSDVSLDSIAHLGNNMLFRQTTNKNTTFALLTGESFSVPGSTSNGIWSTNDQYVYTYGGQRLLQIDPYKGKITSLATVDPTPDSLIFYSNGFIYYIHKLSAEHADFYRVELQTGKAERLIAGGSSAPEDYWLSPDGTTIYYLTVDNTVQTIHAIRTDGTLERQIVTDAFPVGYANDGSLMVVRQVKYMFQLLRVNADLTTQVVAQDIAPGATKLERTAVALSPYAYSIVAAGTYADGSIQFWSIDLTNMNQRRFLTLPASPHNDQLRLIGWDTLLVPGANPPDYQTSTPPFATWHYVLESERSSTTQALQVTIYDTLLNTSYQVNDGKALPNATIDSIAPSGNRILYQSTQNGTTSYGFLSLPAGNTIFYTLPASDAGNAVWMADSRSVLILSHQHGVIKVDLDTQKATTMINHLAARQLTIYRDPYLYFVGDSELVDNAFYRISLHEGSSQQITDSSPGSSFWVNPNGDAVFYVYKGMNGESGIYAAASDGSSNKLFRSTGVPVGYGAKAELMTIQQGQNGFQLVQLASSFSSNEDTIVQDAIAPDATALCDQESTAANSEAICDRSIALAPVGLGLVVEARYADGTRKLLYIDLQQQKTVVLNAQLPNAEIALSGWVPAP